VFGCKICSYKTPRKGNLDRHLYSKHGVKINDGKVSAQIGFGMFEESDAKVASQMIKQVEFFSDIPVLI